MLWEQQHTVRELTDGVAHMQCVSRSSRQGGADTDAAVAIAKSPRGTLLLSYTERGSGGAREHRSTGSEGREEHRSRSNGAEAEEERMERGGRAERGQGACLSRDMRRIEAGQREGAVGERVTASVAVERHARPGVYYNTTPCPARGRRSS